MDHSRTRMTWPRMEMNRTVFLFRTAVWMACVAFSTGNRMEEPVIITAAILLGGGALVAQRVGYGRVNRVSFFAEVLLVTLAVRLTGGLRTDTYLLYGGLAVLTTVYGALRWSVFGVLGMAALYGWATGFPLTNSEFWYRVLMISIFILAAGALGEAYVRREKQSRDTYRRLDQLESLRAIQEGLLKEEPLEVLLETLLSEAVSMLQVDGGFIGTLDASGRLRMTALAGMPESFRLFAWDPVTSEPIASVWRSGRLMTFSEEDLTTLQAREPLEVGFRSLLTCPLFDGAQLIGVMGLGAKQPMHYQADEVAVVETLGTLAAGQIRYDRERTAARKRGRLLGTLDRVGKLVNSSLRMQNLLPVLHQTVAEELSTDSFFVLLTIPGQPEQGYMAYLYDEGRSYEPTVVDLSPDSPTVQVMKSGESRLWVGMPQGSQTIGSDRPVVGMLVAPLSREGRVIGALSAQSYTAPYDQDHLEFLSAVANQAAIAIENAQLYQRAEEVAMTDHLTGLGNARRFSVMGDQVLRKSVDEGRPLSVILIDSDSLKAVNDRLGHAAGDAHLQHLAQTIRSSIRSGDYAFRYAGDEFVVVLPDTSVESAAIVAERIRRAVADGFLWQGERLDNISVSVGVTELRAQDIPDITMEQLFSRADAAMYQAKVGGRNRVAVGY
jgi:diguanylate cyclase (GGDEF)-like protein